MRRVHASDSLTSQAAVTFRDTLPLGYPRSAAPLPHAPPITGDTLSNTSAPSATMFQSHHFRPSLRHPVTVECQVGSVDPVVQF